MALHTGLRCSARAARGAHNALKPRRIWRGISSRGRKTKEEKYSLYTQHTHYHTRRAVAGCAARGEGTRRAHQRVPRACDSSEHTGPHCTPTRGHAYKIHEHATHPEKALRPPHERMGMMHANAPETHRPNPPTTTPLFSRHPARSRPPLPRPLRSALSLLPARRCGHVVEREYLERVRPPLLRLVARALAKPAVGRRARPARPRRRERERLRVAVVVRLA